MSDKHLATFTWGAGAQTVCVAGGFNDWSATATPLHKQADGSFLAEIPLPYGEKQAFKYVVDGQWKVREDEDKEPDAVGNMNNIYTAPAAPAAPAAPVASVAPPASVAPAASSSPTPKSSTPVAAVTAAVAAPVAAVSAAVAAAVGTASSPSKTASTVPSSSTADKAPAATSGDAKSTTEPSTLIAAAAPGAATGAAPVLGVPVNGGSKATSDTPTAGSTTAVPPSTSTPTSAPASNGVSGTDAGVGAAAVGSLSKDKAAAEKAVAEEEKKVLDATKESGLSSGPVPTAVAATPVQIEKAAASANIGEAPAAEEGQGIAGKAAGYGAAAIATLGVVVGGAAAAVEKATGVDLTRSSPLSVEDAKAKGIDVASLDKVDGPSDATAPSGTAPPASAVAALDEKIQELKPGSSKDAAGVAAVPVPNGEAPKTSKHTIPAQPETTANHTSIPQPVFTTLTEKDPKKDRTLAASDLKDTAGTKPINSVPGVDAKEAKLEAESNPAGASGAAKGAIAEKAVAPDTPAKNLVDATPKPVPAAPATPGKTATPAAVATVASGTVTPPKETAAPSTPAKSGAAPVTPSKTNGTATSSSTPATTPAKSTLGKVGDVKKKKSSIFHKIKHAFSPKDKSK